MSKILSKIQKEQYFLSLIIIIFLLRTALPRISSVYFPLIVIVSLFLAYSVYKNGFPFSLKYILKIFFPLILIFLIYVISIIFTKDKPVQLIKELVNILCLIVIFGLLLFSIDSLTDLERYKSTLRKQFIILALLVAILGISKLLLSMVGVTINFLSVNSIYPLGTSLSIDRNFYTLISFFGIICLIPDIRVNRSLGSKILIQLFIFIFFLNIILSSSRRAIILMLIIYAIFFIGWLFSFLSKHPEVKYFRQNTSAFILGVSSFSFILVFFLFFVSPIKKNKYLNLSGWDQQIIRTNVNLIVSQVKSIFFKNANKDEIFNKIWRTSFEPKNPYSGWGNQNFTPVELITGPNSEIVPRGSIGYKLDKSTQSIKYVDGAYSYTDVLDLKIYEGKRYEVCVYAFVSDDFNGQEVRLQATSETFGQISDYDSLKKGTWQKLSLNCTGDNSTIKIALFFILPNNPDFTKLNGHVIFAYPHYKDVLFDPSDPDTYLPKPFTRIFPLAGKNAGILPPNTAGLKVDKSSPYDIWENFTYYHSIVNSVKASKGDTVILTAYCYMSGDFNGEDAFIQLFGTRGSINTSKYDKNKRQTWQKLKIAYSGEADYYQQWLQFDMKNVKNFNQLTGYVIFAYPEMKLSKAKKEISDKVGEINGITSKNTNYGEVSFDSTRFFDPKKYLIGDSAKFRIENAENLFSGPRLDRWRYALYIYRYEYNWVQKLVGGGFDHTRKFAKLFSNGILNFDYPHNPLLSVLLYSGILGLILYLLLLVAVFSLYWQYRNKFYILFLCFIVTLFFSFFSADNPFDPPIMGFLVILPFFIHYVHVKDIKGKSEITNQ
jgi:hypothetical protein